MRETKRQMTLYSFYDHTGLERHFERMAEQGWLLCGSGQYTWHYRRSEPKQLTFCVCYYPRATIFDPLPSVSQEEFYDFCAHTGWTLAASSAQMQVFYNERPNPVPIDTDPAMEVEAIHQSAKKSWLISQILFLILAVLNIGQFLWRLRGDPIATLSSPLSLLALVCWAVMLLLVGTDFATYFRWRRRALKAAEQGEFLATKSHPLFQKLALAVVLAGLVWALFYLQGALGGVMLLSLAGGVLLVAAVIAIREGLKKRFASAETNRTVTILACVALSVLFAAVLPWLVARGLSGRNPAPEELPLTLEDLLEGDFSGYSASWRGAQSPLLGQYTAYQWPLGPVGQFPDPIYLDYEITLVKLPVLYGLCRDHLLEEYDTRGTGFLPVKYFAPMDPAPWGAEEAYQFVMDGETLDLYLLCYEGRIVKLDLDWPPTAEQMAAVGEKLGGR